MGAADSHRDTKGDKDMTQMEKINKIWKNHTGADLTEEEAKKMVDFIKYMLEKADKEIENR